MPVAATPEQIQTAHADYQANVVAMQTASTDYDTTLAPFVEKRKALLAANTKVVTSLNTLAKLLSQSSVPSVPPVPADEE